MRGWIWRGGIAIALLGALAGAAWVSVAARVGTGFAAKVTCSLAHLSGQEIAGFRDYIHAEVAPLGHVLRLSVDDGGAEARSFAGIFRARASFRPGLGCTLLAGDPDRPLATLPEALATARAGLDPAMPWPEGAARPEAPAPPDVAAALDRAFAEPEPGIRRRTKAVVVVQDGRLVAERYAQGYGPTTPMLSWSMAKSVTMALVGVLVGEGVLDPQQPAPVPEWREAGDPRGAITLDQLLRQSSGLAFDETYGSTNDVSRMLFLHADTGAFAAAMPLEADPDTRWSYSSGTSNIITRILRDHFEGDLAAQVRAAHEGLFAPVGITSAVLEPDLSGSFIGSSFVFMTARDWARFGELLRRDGLWKGRRVLPEGWVRYARTPTPAAPRGEYGAHWWLNAGPPGEPSGRPWPRLPPETFAARGHSGQWVVIVPSRALVVVRLGLTTPDTENSDGTEELVAELLQALGKRPGH